MIISVILYATLACAIRFPQKNKPEKMQACYNIIEYKLYRDEEFLNDFFSQFKEPNYVINHYTADMLLKCYTTITLEQAEEVLIQDDNLYLAPYLEDLVKVDMVFYTKGTLEDNSDHQALYEEIQNLVSAQEGQEDNGQNNQNEQSPIGIETLVFVGIVFLCTILAYLASGKTENKPEVQKND